MSFQRLRRSVLLLIPVALLLHGALANTFPLTVVDDLGRTVTIDRAPARIVSMAPSHSESVCALRARERLVGVDTYSNWPAGLESLRIVGDAFSPNVEAIVALLPDLVLVDEYSGLHAALEPLGITVYAGTPQTVAETLEFLTLLGAILGQSTEAAVLVGTIEGELRAVEQLLAGVAGPRTFVELDATPYSAGPGSYVDELLVFAAASNIVTADMGPFPQVDPEYVVASDPEVIVLLDAPYGVTAADVAARPGWGALNAVRLGQVFELAEAEADMLSRAGPRLGQAVLLLARLLHPGRF